MSVALKVYGIKSCDTCRKARRWLEAAGVDFAWIDLRDDTPDPATLQRWLDAVGAERLVNRRSATWRGLDKRRRPALDAPALADTLLEYPTLIKRPVFERAGGIRVGFGDDQRRWLQQA